MASITNAIARPQQRRFRLTLPMRLELDRVLHDIQNLLSFRSSAGRSFLSFYGHCARLCARPILQQQFVRFIREWADVFFLAGYCAGKLITEVVE